MQFQPFLFCLSFMARINSCCPRKDDQVLAPINVSPSYLSTLHWADHHDSTLTSHCVNCLPDKLRPRRFFQSIVTRVNRGRLFKRELCAAKTRQSRQNIRFNPISGIESTLIATHSDFSLNE